MFERFVDSFEPLNRPDVLAMSGGEAFLRQLIEAAHDYIIRTAKA